MTSIPASSTNDRIERVLRDLNEYAYRVHADPDEKSVLESAQAVQAHLREFLPAAGATGATLAQAKTDAKALLDAVEKQQPHNIGLVRHITIDRGPDALKKQFREVFDGIDKLPKFDFSARYGDQLPGTVRNAPSSAANFSAGAVAGQGATPGQTGKISVVGGPELQGPDQAAALKPTGSPDAVDAANSDAVQGPDSPAPAPGVGPAEGAEDPSKDFHVALGQLNLLTNFDAYFESRVKGFNQDIAVTKQLIGRVKELEKKKDRTPEEDSDLTGMKAQLDERPLTDLVKERDNWIKVNKELNDDIKNEYLLIFHGMNGPRGSPNFAFDQVDKSDMGRKYLGLLDHLAGRENTRLTEKELASLKEYLATPQGERSKQLGTLTTVINQFIAAHPGADGKVIEDVVAEMMRSHATGHGVQPSPELTQKLAQLMGVGALRPDGTADAAGSTNPKSPHYRRGGLTQYQRDQLKNYPNAVGAIESWNEAYKQYQESAKSRFNTMMSLLSSGLPIEAILLMFMALMTENEEDKLKLKMREVTVAEEFERMNSEIEYKQKRAEQLWGHYEEGNIEKREQAEPDVNWKAVDQERQLKRLDPTQFGFTSKTSAMLMQELQMQTQTYKQTMEALMATMRVFQDMVNRAVQNIR